MAFPLVLSGSAVVESERRKFDRRRHGYISKLKLFRDVPYSEVEDALVGCPVQEFSVSTVLLRPGEGNASVYLVLEGCLRVHLDAADSPNAILVDAGNCIGEMSIIDGKPVSAYVVAEPGSRILVIDQERFWTSIAIHTRVARNLFKLLAERMRQNNEVMIEGLKEHLRLEHIQKELRFAREIQDGMLPKTFSLSPSHEGRMDLHATIEPAREVGGDLYDFFQMPSGEFCFLVGDVSDKGMAAALFMARTVNILRVLAKHSRGAGGGEFDPAQILRLANRELCEHNTSMMFVTLFFAILDSRSGLLRFSNAGHNWPYLRTAAGSVNPLQGARSAPLGIRAGVDYRTSSTVLADGDLLFAFTDGVTEALGEGTEMFGEARLESALAGCGSDGAAAVTSAVVDAVRLFAGSTPASDDITTLALRLTR